MIMNDVYFKREQDLLRLGVSVLEHRKKMLEAMGKYESSPRRIIRPSRAVS
jgi:hypothetical protein